MEGGALVGAASDHYHDRLPADKAPRSELTLGQRDVHPHTYICLLERGPVLPTREGRRIYDDHSKQTMEAAAVRSRKCRNSAHGGMGERDVDACERQVSGGHRLPSESVMHPY